MTPTVQAPETDFLDALEAKIHEASERLRALRTENRALAQRVADLEAQLAEQEAAAGADVSNEEAAAWRQERDAIRERVESLAGRLEELLEEGEE